MKKWLLILSALLMTSCVGIPKNVQPVQSFELNRYLGTWYEIARLDHSFERGMSQVVARYDLKPDGTVQVLNRGYVDSKRTWKEIKGTAKPVGSPTVGHLKVSFFGPFYGSYIVMDIDPQYQYALVSGPNTRYLWILSKNPSMPEDVKQKYIQKAKQLGFDTDQLIFIKQTPIT